MKSITHALAATAALLCIVCFLGASLIAETLLDQTAIAMVKHAIAFGLWVLIPALMLTGATGFSLARGRQGRLLGQKQRRMPWIALNGLLVLLPAALFLDARASAGVFDAWFYRVQGVELLFGTLQLGLLLRSYRAGLRLRGRWRRQQFA